MSLRFDTTNASGDSAVWSPAGETILQLKAADPRAAVDVMARVHADADWEPIARIRADSAGQGNHFVRLPKFPFLKLSIAKNTATKALKVWDNE